MSADGESQDARAGRWLRRKVLAALVLSSVIPALVMILVVLPALDTSRSQLLVGVTIVGTLAGAWLIWDVGRVASRLGALAGSAGALSAFERGQDEIGTLKTSYHTMLATTEQQAAEINTFAARLDAAYKELESTNARLKETSFKDDITRLYNRRFLFLRLEEEIGRWTRSRQPCSLVLLEPEGLRVVADTAGLAAYDEALVAFARILVAPAGSTVNVMARYDGGRFAVLLVATHRAAALRFVRMVRNAVASEYPHADEILLRVGVASIPEDGADASELMSAADSALRRSLPVD